MKVCIGTEILNFDIQDVRRYHGEGHSDDLVVTQILLRCLV